MAEPRRPRLYRVDVGRDPLFEGVWIGGPGNLPSLPTPPTPPTPVPPASTPFVLAAMAMPPQETDQDKKWQAALAIADSVVARLKEEDGFDPDLLHKVVKDLIEGQFDASDVVAVYLHRKVVTHG